MSRADLEQRLHDFVDGRLSPDEARSFAAELGRDPELAARVEAYRDLGRALREEPGELSPGFYTRARARFEARRTRPAWMRWEAAGLAAAAALALVLFTPTVVERLREAPSASRGPSEAKQDKLQAGATVVAEAEPDLAAGEDIQAQSGLAEIPADPKEKAPAAKPTPPAVARSANAGPGPPPPPGKPAPTASEESAQRAEDEREAGRRHRQQAESFAVADAPDDGVQTRDASTLPTLSKSRAVAPEADRLEAREQAAGFDDDAPQVQELEPTNPMRMPGFPLESGIVAPGEHRELRPGELEFGEERELGQKRADTGAPREGAWTDRNVRIVAVGPRQRPLNCARTLIRSRPEVYEILLRFADGQGPADLHGCGVRLPDDGRPVRIVEPESGTR